MTVYIKKKKAVSECDGGAGCAPLTGLADVNGMGNPQPAQAAAMTAVEQSGAACIGSGDNFGGGLPVATQGVKKKRKFKLKKTPDVTRADNIKY